MVSNTKLIHAAFKKQVPSLASGDFFQIQSGVPVCKNPRVTLLQARSQKDSDAEMAVHSPRNT